MSQMQSVQHAGGCLQEQLWLNIKITCPVNSNFLFDSMKELVDDYLWYNVPTNL